MKAIQLDTKKDLNEVDVIRFIVKEDGFTEIKTYIDLELVKIFAYSVLIGFGIAMLLVILTILVMEALDSFLSIFGL